jgi:repressor LexA
VTTRAPLTPAERAVYHLLIDHLAEHTFQPSVREIGRQLKIPSTKTVTDLLASLEAKGYVRRGGGRSRGVVLLGFAGGVGTIPVPVMRIATETPSDADRPAGDTLVLSHHLTIDRTLVPSEESFLLVHAGAAIPSHAVRPEDLLLIDPSGRATETALLAVRVAGRIDVRPLLERGVILRLGGATEPDELRLGVRDEYAVLGVVAGVIRAPAPTSR